PSATAFVSILHATGTPRFAGLSWMDAAARLNACLLVSADHKFIVLQRFLIPVPAVQIQHPACLLAEIGILWEDPTPVVPGADRILMEPPPERTTADRSHQTGLANFPSEFGCAPARQGHLMYGWKFT